jgi:isopentenyl diphosphate isomerase/L-lactate dehydrogenase-like FMN-dependent dehydrogenase
MMRAGTAVSGLTRLLRWSSARLPSTRRRDAKRCLPRGIFEFVDRATEDHLAVTENRAGFQGIKLRHRALVDVSCRSTKTMLFGKEVSLPMIIAPTGAAGLCWYRGEFQLAGAAAKAGIPFATSTASMAAMEEVAEQAGGRLWSQLYVWKRRDLSYQAIERAKKPATRRWARRPPSSSIPAFAAAPISSRRGRSVPRRY